jgi:hypothetical protein
MLIEGKIQMHTMIVRHHGRIAFRVLGWLRAFIIVVGYAAGSVQD